MESQSIPFHKLLIVVVNILKKNHSFHIYGLNILSTTAHGVNSGKKALIDIPTYLYIISGSPLSLLAIIMGSYVGGDQVDNILRVIELSGLRSL